MFMFYSFFLALNRAAAWRLSKFGHSGHSVWVTAKALQAFRKNSVQEIDGFAHKPVHVYDTAYIVEKTN